MELIKFGIKGVVFCLIGAFFIFCAIKDYKKGAFAACGIDVMITWWMMCCMMKLTMTM
jgi:hypothetical protein